MSPCEKSESTHGLKILEKKVIQFIENDGMSKKIILNFFGNKILYRSLSH